MDSIDCTATFYMLDGGGEIFRTHLGPTQPPIKWERSPFSGNQSVGARRLPPNHIQLEGDIKSRPIAQPRTEIYLQFLSKTATGLAAVTWFWHQVLLQSVRRFENWKKGKSTQGVVTYFCFPFPFEQESGLNHYYYSYRPSVRSLTMASPFSFSSHPCLATQAPLFLFTNLTVFIRTSTFHL